MRQLSLFEESPRTVTHIVGLTAMIKAAMNRAAASSALSRQQLVDRVNRLSQAAGVRLTQGNAKSITLDTLEKWLNPQETGHVPGLLAVEVFMLAVNCVDPLSAWMDLHDMEVMSKQDRHYRDYGKAMMEKEEAAEKARNTKQALKEARKQ